MFASSDRQSGSLVRVPTSFGSCLIRRVVWVVCVRDVPSGVARGAVLWTLGVSGTAPAVVGAGGVEPCGAATVESSLLPVESIGPARWLQVAVWGRSAAPSEQQAAACVRSPASL